MAEVQTKRFHEQHAQQMRLSSEPEHQRDGGHKEEKLQSLQQSTQQYSLGEKQWKLLTGKYWTAVPKNNLALLLRAE